MIADDVPLIWKYLLYFVEYCLIILDWILKKVYLKKPNKWNIFCLCDLICFEINFFHFSLTFCNYYHVVITCLTLTKRVLCLHQPSSVSDRSRVILAAPRLDRPGGNQVKDCNPAATESTQQHSSTCISSISIWFLHSFFIDDAAATVAGTRVFL